MAPGPGGRTAPPHGCSCANLGLTSGRCAINEIARKFHNGIDRNQMREQARRISTHLDFFSLRSNEATGAVNYN